MNKKYTTFELKEEDITCISGDNIYKFLASGSHRLLREIRSEFKRAFPDHGTTSPLNLGNVVRICDHSMLGKIKFLPTFIDHIKNCSIRVETLLDNGKQSHQSFKI